MSEEKKTQSAAAWWQPALLTFAKMSFWIALPIILAVFGGKWLDERYGTEPWLFLISVGAGFLISMIGLVREALREFKKIEALSGQKNKIKKTEKNGRE